uniref:Uncharacterized protein n=1 Tax=Arundo donax TaxID=35708 RepID=A0A0A9FPF8_ARUDO
MMLQPTNTMVRTIQTGTLRRETLGAWRPSPELG